MEMDFIKSHWRPIITICLFFSLLFFRQYIELVFIAWFIFSIVIIFIEWRRINKFIKDYILLDLAITILSIIIYFFAKVRATTHFNNKYEIFAEYLNYSVTAWAGITGTIVLITICSLILSLCLAIKIKKMPIKQGKDLIKLVELFIHSFSCILLCIWITPIFQLVDKHDKTLLYLDAYQYSDCQIPEHNIAIRKDNETCYLFKFKGILLDWELEKHQSKKP